MALIGEMKYLTIGSKTYQIPVPESGSSVEFTPNLTSGTKVGDLTINNSTVSLYAPTNTDTKLQIAAVTSGTTYYPVVATNSTTAATRQYDATGLAYAGTNGTTSAVGTAKITLGNSTASGTANNKKGQITLYGSTAYATTIDPGSPTAARTITLPNATGTVALTSDIPTVSYPVTSVNTKTGAVSLTASDVGAVAKSGDTMTGLLTTKSNVYDDAYTGALNLANSNIYGVNSIYTADVSDDSRYGIHFYHSVTTVDSVHAKSGILYFTPNRTLGSVGTSYQIYHSGNLTGDAINGGYINTHPENSPVIIPFIHNDIAFLLKKGGSAIVRHDGSVVTKDLSNVFDGSSTYLSYSAAALANITTILIELTLHRSFTYSNWIYIDFGNVGWRAKSVKFLVMNSNYANDVWTQKYNTTNNTSGHIAFSTSHAPVDGTTANGFNKLKITLSTWNSTQFRISQIGIYNYDSAGVRETYMSRGVDDPVFRNITPNETETYSLGSSTKKWANVYTNTLNGTTIPSSPVFTDTKNTAGATTTGSTLYLIGTTLQTANPQTYTVGANSNHLYFSAGLKSQAYYSDNKSYISQNPGGIYLFVEDKDYSAVNLDMVRGTIVLSNRGTYDLDLEDDNYILFDGLENEIRIKGLVTPTNNSDAATKKYVDDHSSDTKNTAGSTNTSSKIFLIGATSQAANPQTYSHDTAYVGTDGKLYSASKVVLVGGSNASSSVSITPTTTAVYSMTSAGSVTAGTAASFTRGTFSQGTLPTMTWAMDSTDTKKLNITFSQGTLPTHAADSFTANTPTAVTLPGRSSAINAWTGYSAATAAAQTFTGVTA